MSLWSRISDVRTNALRAARTRRRAGGFTAAEVLMAIMLFAIGGAGVIAMERTAIQGNADARRMDQANAIAAEWQDRIQRESVLWVKGTPTTAIPVINNALAFPAWTNPAIPASTSFGISPAFDINGDEILNGGTGPQPGQEIFCVQYRLQALQNDPTQAGSPPIVFRTEVAVWWQRNLNTIGAPACGDPAFAPTTATFHAVYVTSMLRQN